MYAPLPGAVAAAVRTELQRLRAKPGSEGHMVPHVLRLLAAAGNERCLTRAMARAYC